MKVVMFPDGKFYIRKWSWFVGYKFYSPIHRWWYSKESSSFETCAFETSVDAFRQVDFLIGNGTVVKRG